MNEEHINNSTIISLLENDDLSRNRYLIKFIQLINNNGYNKIFSLDGGWGSGKTVFIKKLNLLINFCHSSSMNKECSNIFNEKILSDKEYEQLNNIVNTKYKEFNEIVKEGNINSIYFNAWEHDDEDDPILSILFDVIKKYELTDRTINMDAIINSINILVKKVSRGLVDIPSISNNNDLKENINKKEEIKKIINETTNELINENCNKLIIFVDELDRCNPKYAVKLLERIKHYFNDERILFVISTNLIELSNTISGLYGSNFSSSQYLDKFFDIRLELPTVDISKYLNTFDSNINRFDKEWFYITIECFIKYKKLSLREINRYMGCIRFFEKEISINKNRLLERYHNLINFLFVPYCIGLYIKDVQEYNNFINKDGWNELHSFIINNENMIQLCMYTLYNNTNNQQMNTRTDESILNDINNLYNLIFEKSKDGSCTIDGQIIYKYNVDNFEEKISLLGYLSEFSNN